MPKIQLTDGYREKFPGTPHNLAIGEINEVDDDLFGHLIANHAGEPVLETKDGEPDAVGEPVPAEEAPAEEAPAEEAPAEEAPAEEPEEAPAEEPEEAPAEDGDDNEEPSPEGGDDNEGEGDED